MSTPLWPAPTYADGDFTIAKPCALPVFSSPLPNVTDQSMFRQPFMQFAANVAPLALNTPYSGSAGGCIYGSGYVPDLSTYFLIKEGEKQDLGNGIVRWERTYSQVPASYDDWQSYAYNIIGTAPIGPMTSNQVGRMRSSERVTCRIQNDFFKLGATVTDPITGASVTPTTPGGIPQIFALAYCSQFLTGEVQYGGYFYRQDYVSDYLLSTTVGWLTVSTPSATDYQNMIADAAANGWGAGKSFQVLGGTSPVLVDVASLNTAGHTYYKGQLVAEDSSLERWQNAGSIWVRKTIYVLAR
jgi:hypothetical protein